VAAADTQTRRRPTQARTTRPRSRVPSTTYIRRPRSAAGATPARPDARQIRTQPPGTGRQRFAAERPTQLPKGGRVPSGNYQPVILAEFVACILLTAVTPFASGKASEGVSPYAGADMVKLGAITVTYMILGFVSVSGQRAARLAAWLGGLILLADGLYEASNLAKDLQVLSAGLSGYAAAASGTATTSGATAGSSIASTVAQGAASLQGSS